jgi:hypothetical protein
MKIIGQAKVPNSGRLRLWNLRLSHIPFMYYRICEDVDTKELSLWWSIKGILWGKDEDHPPIQPHSRSSAGQMCCKSKRHSDR